MQKFQFSLAKVLDVRWTAEEDAKQAYAAAQQALFEKEAQLQILQQEKNELMDIPEIGINRMQVRYWYLMELERQTALAKQQLVQLQQAVEMALTTFIQAQKERKILEKLEEKQHETYLLDEKREEQKMLDEMGIREKLIM